jgi:hypothetical protein
LDRRQRKTLKLNQVGILSFIFTQTLSFSTWLAQAEPVYTTSHISRIQCRIHRSHGGTSPLSNQKEMARQSRHLIVYRLT